MRDSRPAWLIAPGRSHPAGLSIPREVNPDSLAKALPLVAVEHVDHHRGVFYTRACGNLARLDRPQRPRSYKRHG